MIQRKGALAGCLAAALLQGAVHGQGAAVSPPWPRAPVATFEVDPRHQIRRDERYVLFQSAEAGCVLVDLPDAKAIALPSGGPWQAGWLVDGSEQLWLIDGGGLARCFGLPELQPLASIPAVEIGIPKLADEQGRGPRFHDLVVAPDGAHVAWSLAAGGEQLAGVHAVASGEEVARFPAVDTAAMSDLHLPWIAFIDAAHVVVHRPRDREELEVVGGDSGDLEIWSLAKRHPVARLEPYVASSTPGYALLPDGLALGTRTDTHRWPVVRWQLGAEGSTLLLESARGGHFTDLRLSPSGRWLVEADREDDDGVMVIDITGKTPPRTIAGEGHFVGFVANAERVPATGVTVPEGFLLRDGAGALRRHHLESGEAAAVLPFFPRDFSITSARWCRNGWRLLAVGYRAGTNQECRYEAQLWSLHPLGK